MTNESFFPIINNTYSNNNFFDNDLFSNYSYWPCKLGKCKVEKVILNEIKILRIVYFILFILSNSILLFLNLICW